MGPPFIDAKWGHVYTSDHQPWPPISKLSMVKKWVAVPLCFYKKSWKVRVTIPKKEWEMTKESHIPIIGKYLVITRILQRENFKIFFLPIIPILNFLKLNFFKKSWSLRPNLCPLYTMSCDQGPWFRISCGRGLRPLTLTPINIKSFFCIPFGQRV